MAPVAAAVAAWWAEVVVSELVIDALIYTAISFAVSKLLTPKMKSGASRSMEANYYNSEQRAPILMGHVRTGGMEVIPPITTGSDGRYLHRVLAVAGHEVSSYGDVYFDTIRIQQSEISAISQTHSSGYVTLARYWDDQMPAAWIRCYRGTATDSMDFLLNYADGVSFGSEFRGRGIAKVMFRYRFTPNAYQGVPQHTIFVSGAKVYDPRAAQDMNDESTWLWSRNPALLAAWYCVKWGGYEAAAELDWDSVSTAADICDESVTIPYSTQARYTCNGQLFAHTSMQEFQDNLDLIVQAMLGAVVYANGQWHFYAGAWETPTETIPDSAWLSPPQIVLEGGVDKRHNRVHCWYIDPTRNWQRSECYPRYNPTYAAADGGILEHGFDQPLCTNEWEAQRKAELILRQTRNQVLVSGRLGPQYQNLSLNQTVYVDLSVVGWEAKSFRVVNFTLNPDGTVNITLQEEQAADWTDLAEVEYNLDSMATIPENTPPLPSAPTALTAAQLVAGTIQFTVGVPQHVPRETSYRILVSPYVDGYGNGSYSVLGAASALVMTLSDSYWSQTRYYWAQSMRANSPGGIYPASSGLPVFVLPPADNTLNNDIVPDQEFSIGTPANWTWNGLAYYAVFAYVPDLPGGTDGGGRVAVVGPYAGRPALSLKARPHPNRVSSYGLPAGVGYAAYEAHVRWRVNSFTVMSSYATNSGGYFLPIVRRVDETNTERAYASPGPTAELWSNPAGMAYFADATLGAMNDATFYMAFGKRTSASYRGFDYAELLFKFNDGDTDTNIEIDRFIVKSLGGRNAPTGPAALVSSPYALVSLSEQQFIAEITAVVGSVGFRVGNNDFWPIGLSAFCGKKQGAATCWIYGQSPSYFLTLAGTTSLVNTLTMANSALVNAVITRTGSYNYMVSGAGIS